MHTHVTWDGRRRRITDTWDFTGHRVGEILEADGWEPKWYFVSKKVFHLSKVDGGFYPARYETAPGWRKP
jgi:hypothetical protein